MKGNSGGEVERWEVRERREVKRREGIHTK